MKKIHLPEIYEKIMEQKDLVKRKIITIGSVAKKFGVPESTISAWYRGRQPFFKIYLKRLKYNKELRKTVIKQIPESAKVLTPEKSYILGVLCGDGYVNYKDHYISLETITIEFIHKFRECCIKVYGPDFCGSITPTCNGKQRIIICGKEMTEDIRKYLPGKGTFTWKVPEEINRLSEDCKISFIQGFFDSEGRVHKKYSLDVTSVNRIGLSQLKKLFGSLHIKTSEIKSSNNKKYTLYITGKENIVKFINKIGTNIPDKLKKMKELLLKYGIPG